MGGMINKLEGENFLAFSKRFKSLMILENPIYENMLNNAESRDTEITGLDFSDDESIELSKKLKLILLLYCD